MSKPASAWKGSAGYLLMFVLGSAGTWLVSSRESATTDAEKRASRSSGRVTYAAGPEGMLARLTAQKLKPTPTPLDIDARCLKRIAELRKSLRPAADPAAAAKAAVEGAPFFHNDLIEELENTLERRAEVAARFIQWLEADPDAALAYASGKVGRFTGPEMALRVWVTEIPRDVAFEKIRSDHYESQYAVPLVRGAFDHAITTGDIDTLKAIMEFDRTGDGGTLLGSATGDNGNGWSGLAFSSWPKNKLEELRAYAMESKNPGLISALMMRLSPAEASSQAKTLLNNEADHAALRDQSRTLAGKVANDTSLPLDQRVELIDRLGALPGNGLRPDPDLGKKLIVRSEYTELQSSGQLEAWKHALASGAMDAQGFRDAMTAAMKDGSTLDPKAVHQLVTEAIIAADPLKNLALIPEIPNDGGDRERAIFSGVYSMTPGKLYELEVALASDPDLGKPAIVAGRWQTYLTNRMGDGKAEQRWVESLPPGLNRDAALSGLAQSIESFDPRRASALRAKIANPAALK